GRHGGGRGLDAVDLFHVVAQLDRLGDRQRYDFVADVLDVGGPDATVPFSHRSLSFLRAGLLEAEQRLCVIACSWFGVRGPPGRALPRGRRLPGRPAPSWRPP